LGGTDNGGASQPHDGSGAHDDTEQAGEGDHSRVTTTGDLVAALYRTRVTLAGTTAVSGHWIGRNGDAAGYSEGRDERDEGFVKHNCED
jgi:hypothetical protein